METTITLISADKDKPENAIFEIQNWLGSAIVTADELAQMTFKDSVSRNTRDFEHLCNLESSRTLSRVGLRWRACNFRSRRPRRLTRRVDEAYPWRCLRHGKSTVTACAVDSSKGGL